MLTWDWVVVGAGSSGCVLADRLSAVGSVLLVEAGPDLPDDPGPWAGPGSVPDWGYVTPPQPGLLGRGSPEPHGRLVGGTSAINAVFYMRPDPADLDAWAVPGWSYADLLPYFRRVEGCVDEPDPGLGRDGPLRLERGGGPSHPLVRAFTAAAEVAGHKPLDHFDGPEGCVGVSGFRVNRAAAGPDPAGRVTAKEAYLDPARGRSTLDVWPDTLAVGLVMAGERCTGVRLVRDGLPVDVAAGEVVLCASTAESPKLLMLSGIGPEAELRRHGIPVRHRLDGVGANLQDHVMVTAGLSTTGPVAPLDGVEAAVFTGRPGAAGPVVETLVLPDAPAALLVDVLLQPRSRGTVTLASADPQERPVVDPRFLDAPRDATDLADAVRRSAELLRTAPLAGWISGRRDDPPPDRADDLERWVRARATSQNHMAGSCRMGQDEDAVVDPELRVRGLAGLRVVDISVQPRLVAAHAQATVLATAERAADLMTGTQVPR